MMFFKCQITYNELVSLDRILSDEVYCVIKNPGDNYYYGVMPSTAYDKLIEVLSGDSLVNLEYLDQDEFRKGVVLIDTVKSYPHHIIGNTDLLQ